MSNVTKMEQLENIDYSLSETEYKDEQMSCFESQTKRILSLMYYKDELTIDQRIQLEQALATAKVYEALDGIHTRFSPNDGVLRHLEEVVISLRKITDKLDLIG